MDNIAKFIGTICSSYWGTTILVIAAFAFALICSVSVKTTFSKYNAVSSTSGKTAAEVARAILDNNGLYNVGISRISGNLTDNYNPSQNTVFLSDSVYSSYSVGAIGVAAHEVGHAIQHNTSYLPIKIRNFILPAAQLGSTAWYFLVIIGFIAQLQIFVTIGIVFFAFTTVFQLVTLPVELNASRRAINSIKSLNILSPVETKGASKVLKAAAMTYVAAIAVSLAQLLRLLARANRRN